MSSQAGFAGWPATAGRPSRWSWRSYSMASTSSSPTSSPVAHSITSCSPLPPSCTGCSLSFLATLTAHPPPRLQKSVCCSGGVGSVVVMVLSIRAPAGDAAVGVHINPSEGHGPFPAAVPSWDAMVMVLSTGSAAGVRVPELAALPLPTHRSTPDEDYFIAYGCWPPGRNSEPRTSIRGQKETALLTRLLLHKAAPIGVRRADERGSGARKHGFATGALPGPRGQGACLAPSLPQVAARSGGLPFPRRPPRRHTTRLLQRREQGHAHRDTREEALELYEDMLWRCYLGISHNALSQ